MPKTMGERQMQRPVISILAKWIVAISIAFLPISLSMAATPPATTMPTKTSTEHVTVSLKDSALIDVIASDAAQKADHWASAREDKLWWAIGIIFTVVLGLFGFLGIKSLPDLRRQVLAEITDHLHSDEKVLAVIRDEIEKQFKKDVTPRFDRLTEETAFYQFWNQADEVARGTGFTPALRD